MKLGFILGLWCYTDKDGGSKYYRVMPIDNSDRFAITWGRSIEGVMESKEVIKVSHQEAYRRTLSKALGGYVFLSGLDSSLWSHICQTEVESISEKVEQANKNRLLRKPRQKKVTLLDWISGATISEPQNNLAKN